MRRGSRQHLEALALSALLLSCMLLVAGDAGAVDTTPPAVVTDLRVVSVTQSSVTLGWTAPGDDGMIGQATWYDIRYTALGPITDSNFYSATYYTSPFPGPPGSTENFTLTGLQSGVKYWFAVKTSDEVPNWAAASNSPSAVPGAPAEVPPVATNPPWDLALIVAILASGLTVALALVIRRKRSRGASPRPTAPGILEELRPGRAYLVEGRSPDLPLKLLANLDGGTRPVLAISRMELDVERTGRDASRVQAYRLVDRGSPRGTGLLPPSLERTGLLVEEFLAAEPRGALFLEGIEFLSDNNNFAGVLRLVRLIVDRIVRTDHVFLVSVAPGILPVEDLRRLENEMRVLTPLAS